MGAPKSKIWDNAVGGRKDEKARKEKKCYKRENMINSEITIK